MQKIGPLSSFQGLGKLRAKTNVFVLCVITFLLCYTSFQGIHLLQLFLYVNIYNIQNLNSSSNTKDVLYLLKTYNFKYLLYYNLNILNL